ncbi:MAG: HAMP domain-containing protein [Chloroflexi bacterium]|nr:HAMP domain-containing protein [Chloroflexota bacterium]
MMLSTVLVSAVGIAAATWLTWIVTRPILALKQAAQTVGQGDFSQHVTPWANDEIGELAQAFNAMTSDLGRVDQERSEREQLRSQLLEKVISAQEEERRRIARELHDETGQSLTSLIVRLQTLNQQCTLPELRPANRQARQLVASPLEEVHNLSRELRPSVLGRSRNIAPLQRYIQDYQHRHRIDVDFVVLGLGEERLPATIETALYRIVQEGLTNVARHAKAETVSVLLEQHVASGAYHHRRRWHWF